MKLLTRIAMVGLLILGMAVSATAAPIVTIESLAIAPGTTIFDLDVTLSTDASYPIDTAAFELLLPTGVTFTSATFGTLPSGWTPTANPATNRFGASDGGWPPTEITSSLLFATLFFSLDSALSIAGNSFTIGFDYSELANADGTIYSPASYALNPGIVNVNAVPIPAAAWLLGSGLIGLVAVRRRMRK